MKIVHICVTGIWGEQYAYQENLLPHYHKIMGNEVTIIASTYSKYTEGKPVEEPVGISYLQDGTKLIRLQHTIPINLINKHLHLVSGLKKSILEENPDLLFVHDLACLNFKCLVSIKRMKPNIKIVFDNHADYVNSLHSPITKFLHKVIYRFYLAKDFIQIADCFYGVTPSRCDFLHDAYRIPHKKINLLIMGADDEKMQVDKKEQLRKEVRDRYNITDNDFLIISGGKIDLKKNIHVLANAVNNINNEKIKILIFGTISSDLETAFQKERSNKVQTIGWIQSDKVYELFYAADLIMFTGLHSVLWEQAVASKTPCAFSKIEGFTHVSFNSNCILLENNTSSYYQKVLNDVLNDGVTYNRLKVNSNSKLTEQFYYSNIAKQVIEDSHI
ncbi:glycosyltransferase [Macellibacteroides fermentans]|uniref:Glycosyltransferase involved in cell wall bisynthesis n=1 Tax=Parabacteroides chartae TaxID=1037355 RepID=A0A1T5ANF4_9BACT|nr:glycosyltransferase [Parabacteroides chartae]SKB36561.1 Glycosyltransferase involved in cell wall bisynthesis [Parabacteroides chartae]